MKMTYNNAELTLNNNDNFYGVVIISQPLFRVHMVHLMDTHTHTQPFNGPLSRTTRVSRHQKGWILLKQETEWQWHQLGHMQVCTSIQTDNHVSTPPLSFLQAGCPSCHPTNSVKALKANLIARLLDGYSMCYNDQITNEKHNRCSSRL